MTDARERLIQAMVKVLYDRSDGDVPYLYFEDEATAVVDAILSEGCRGDLAEAAGLPTNWLSTPAFFHGKREARLETASAALDAFDAYYYRDEIELADVRQKLRKLARSFTEESSDGPVVQLAPGQAELIKLPGESSDE